MSNDQRQPTVAFKTVGCRLNQAETARIAGSFKAHGYRIVDFGTPSDVAVIHTCTITQNAERKCLQAARSIKRATPKCFVVLAGCAVETDREGIRERSGADLVANQEEKLRIPELVSPRLFTHSPARPFSPSPTRPVFPTTRALVKVQDGCDFRCAYCIVPDARGAPRSVPSDHIIADVERTARDGFREIVLTGANLGCYRDADRGLVDLLAMLEKIQGIERIRLSSIELSTVEREVIDFMADSSKLCDTLHLPLQTGDDGLLKTMGRRYSANRYRELVAYAISRIPRLGLGTDVLVGLPGETDAAFSNTAALLEELPFSNLHIFPYSPRPGTPAAAMENQVPETTRRQRCAMLKHIAERKRISFARQFIGEPVSVLVESVSSDVGKGWTSEYVQAHVQQPGIEVNDIIQVSPTSSQDGQLFT